jgi:hypothetical protein
MTPNPDSSIPGGWNGNISINPRKNESFHRSSMDVTEDQMKEVYRLLYPFIASEFVHRSDLAAYTMQIKKEFDLELKRVNAIIDQLLQIIQNHTHISAPPGSPTSPIFVLLPSLEISSWSSLSEDPEFKHGENHILPKDKYLPALRRRDDKTPDNVTNADPANNIISQLSGTILTPFDAGKDVERFVDGK